MKQHYRSISLLLLIAGLLVLCFGIYLPFQPRNDVALANIAIMEEGILTTGEVTEIRKTMQKDPGKENNPEAKARLYEIVNIKYVVDGKHYNATGLRPIQNPSWEKGDSVKVAYKSDDPKVNAVAEKGVEGINSHPYLSTLLVALGALMSSLGIFSRLKRSE